MSIPLINYNLLSLIDKNDLIQAEIACQAGVPLELDEYNISLTIEMTELLNKYGYNIPYYHSVMNTLFNHRYKNEEKQYNEIMNKYVHCNYMNNTDRCIVAFFLNDLNLLKSYLNFLTKDTLDLNHLLILAISDDCTVDIIQYILDMDAKITQEILDLSLDYRGEYSEVTLLLSSYKKNV